MFRTITRLTLGITGVGLYCYDHQHKIRHHILGEDTIKPPHYSEHPPTFEVELKKDFEKDFDEHISEMENKIKTMDEGDLDEDRTFRGKILRDQSGDLVPSGIGCLREKKGSTYTGKFHAGTMEGYVKVVTSGKKFPKLEKCLYEKGNKEYSIVYHEDGVRCEGKSDCFACVRPDGSAYSEKIDKENGVVKAFLYDSEFNLKSERTLSYPDKVGEGRHFYQNGNVYIGEMNATGPYGKGIIKDHYGDIIYEGQVDNNTKEQQNTRLWRTLLTLGCFIGSFVI